MACCILLAGTICSCQLQCSVFSSKTEKDLSIFVVKRQTYEQDVNVGWAKNSQKAFGWDGLSSKIILMIAWQITKCAVNVFTQF